MTERYADATEHTLPMTVANTGFMLDRLGKDCAPLQFLRELTQNAIEAVEVVPDEPGEIVWDVDWITHDLSDVYKYKLCIIDNGVGMTGEEMVRFINQLSSSIHTQSHDGNFGVGAKIAAATRNHEGLLYLSWKDSIGYMIHLWRDPQTNEYGLRQFERPDGTFGHWAYVEDSVKPDQIKEHGTKVVLLGNEPAQNTMQAPEGAASPSRWIGRYLNARYFRIPTHTSIKAREGWDHPRTDGDRNLLRTVVGQEHYLGEHSQASGSVPLTNATARWWILRDEKALTQNSGFIASSGHIAALHNDELYEMSSGRGGVARLQMFGIIFSYQRVVVYVEPHADSPDVDLTTNTARTQLILNSAMLPWADWAAEFRAGLPEEIRALEEQVSGGSAASDHKQAIRERLRQIRELFGLSRYRPTPRGTELADDESGAGGTSRQASEARDPAGSSPAGNRAARAGNIYGLFLAADGVPAEAFNAFIEPEVDWLSAIDPKCKRRGPGLLEDKAAKYLIEQNKLLINADFRVFNDMIDRWCDRYAHAPGARDAVTDVVREWFEQALVETVLGVQGLRDSKEWDIDAIRNALSEETLSAAVMQRYHVDVAIKRALGAKLGTLKEKAS